MKSSKATVSNIISSVIIDLWWYVCGLFNSILSCVGNNQERIIIKHILPEEKIKIVHNVDSKISGKDWGQSCNKCHEV